MNIYLFLALKFIKGTRKGVLSFLTYFSFIGITLGVAALMVTIGIMSGFRNEIESRLLRFTPHVIVYPAFSNYLNEEDTKRISSILDTLKKVDFYQPFVILKTVVKHRELMDGVVLKFVKETPPYMQGTLVDGKLDLDGLVVGVGLASRLSITVGDTLEVFSPIPIRTPFGERFISRRFPVSAIVDAGIYDINETFILTGIGNTHELYDAKGFTGIEIFLRKPYDAVELARTLRDELGGYSIVTWMDMNKAFFSAIELEKLGMFIVLLLIVLVASFNIVALIGILVRMKLYEIGILRAIGMGRNELFYVFFLVGFIIGILGIVLGLVLGIVSSFIITSFIELPPEIYFIDRIPFMLNFKDVMLIVSFALIIVVLFSLISARHVLSIRITDALRRDR